MQFFAIARVVVYEGHVQATIASSARQLNLPTCGLARCDDNIRTPGARRQNYSISHVCQSLVRSEGSIELQREVVELYRMLRLLELCGLDAKIKMFWLCPRSTICDHQVLLRPRRPGRNTLWLNTFPDCGPQPRVCRLILGLDDRVSGLTWWPFRSIRPSKSGNVFQ